MRKVASSNIVIKSGVLKLYNQKAKHVPGHYPPRREPLCQRCKERTESTTGFLHAQIGHQHGKHITADTVLNAEVLKLYTVYSTTDKARSWSLPSTMRGIICHDETLKEPPREKTQFFAIFIAKTWGATVPDRL
ncbi:hypothetical protein A2U01_0019717, partial [Trifolium medium]|nr:hypothetical protein [Trifolium medium]